MSYFFDTVWPDLLLALHIVVGLALSVVILLRRHEVRAAVAWLGLIWLSPFIGGAIYLLFGINRIARRAVRLRAPRTRPAASNDRTPEDDAALLPADARHLASLIHLVDRLTGASLAPGNRMSALNDGDEAFPTMIEAIEGAERSVALSSYIFNHDATGRRFADALAAAVARGVAVRVLVDGVGSLYSLPPVTRALAHRDVPCARFLYSLFPWRMPYLNLRSHRKLLVVDGRIGFTGGLNIKQGHWLASNPGYPTRGLHFRIEGPAVAAMTGEFAEEWAFTTDEELTGEAWFPALPPVGDAALRAISSGPDERLGKIEWTLLGAINSAEHSIRIVTPYFLPDRQLVAALSVAALRGLAVDIVLPGKNNLPFVKWAASTTLEDLLGAGCRIWFSPAPFDHTKLMLVDGV
jgi:cardiolipin synthase A/B